jgi:hypothetical protein
MTQICSGVLQTGLYIDFLYKYFQNIKEGKGSADLPF